MKQRFFTSHTHDTPVLSIDYYAGCSRLGRISPALKLVAVLVFITENLLADSFAVSWVLTFSMAWLVICKGGLKPGLYMRFLLLPGAFILFGSLGLMGGVSRLPLGDYRLGIGSFFLYTTEASMYTAALTASKAVGAVSCLYMLSLTTPFYNILRVLGKCRIPRPVTEIMMMMYRFIFILLDIRYRLTVSAKSRLGYTGFRSACRSSGYSLAGLLVIALKKTDMFYNAMEARCYNGEIRFLENDKPASCLQKAAVVLYAAFLLCIRILPF